MRRLTLSSALLVAAGLARVAAAQDSHYWTYGYGPIGQLTEGTLVGGVSDLSATYYNPAACALIDRPRFVFNVTSFDFAQIQMKDAAGSGLDVDQMVSRPVPAMLAFHIGPHEEGNHFAFAFLSRYESDFDLGYSMTRANSAKQFSFGGSLSYRDQHHVDSLFVNVFRSSQSNAPDTNRWDLGNDFRRLLGDRWYVNTTQDFLNSDEQQLQLRTTIGGGGGRYLLRSSLQYLALGGGLAWTNERYTDAAAPTKDSGEAYAGTEFMTERLKFVDLLTRFTYYPSLTIDSRYRLTYKLNFDFNLPGDWYWRISYFDNYDSLPPTDTAKNDYGWSNAFGLKF